MSRPREIVLTGFIFAAVFTLVAMVGWRVDDPIWWRASGHDLRNPCGVVGAHLADLVFVLVGHGGWLLVPLVGIATVGLAGRRLWSTAQWIGAATLVVAVLAMLHLALRGTEWHGPGGLVGEGVALWALWTVGPVGSWLVLLAAAFSLTTLLAEIRWSSVVAAALHRAEAVVPVVATQLGDGWRQASGGVGGAVSAVGGAASVVGGGLGAAGSGLGWLVGTAASRLVGLGVGVVGAFVGLGRRMGQAVLRTAGPPRPRAERWDDEGDASSVWEDSVLSDPDPSVPDATAVRHGRALVQAEWERTSADADVLSLFPPIPSRGAADDAGPTPVSAPGRASAPVTQGQARGPVAGAFAQARTPTPPAAATALPVGPGVQVHHNALLDVHVKDDGRALRQAAFKLPALSLLDEVPEQNASYDERDLRDLAAVLEEKLASFGVKGEVVGVRPGPVVTIFEFLPEAGIKVSRIQSLSDDLAMALKALRVRIVAPIPGRGVVGVEIPSQRRLTVFLRELLASDEFRTGDAALPAALGKDVSGRPVVADLTRMPHLLIGGTTGSGKSVGVNGILMSLLYTRTPDELRLLLVDPKMLEFEMYSDIPHLLHPVVTDPKVAAQALAWACREMDERYALLAKWGTRNIVGYNQKVEKELAHWDGPYDERPKKLPYIVVVVDELADLMMVSGKEVEESICRIAQKARACGIHLIVATQRPSVDVVTGLIKANLPTRIAFQLRSRHDSRTVLDEIGAENLLGKGDMLYMPPGVGGIDRCHGPFVSDDEVSRVTAYLRSQGTPDYIETLSVPDEGGADADLAAEQDELYEAAVQVVLQSGKASTSMIQRHLKIGYNRAARIIDIMEARGVVGPADGARPREVLVGSVGG
jgi:DNA segregation ATPase FtsK/SpoIIIE-like protein